MKTPVGSETRSPLPLLALCIYLFCSASVYSFSLLVPVQPYLESRKILKVRVYWLTRLRWCLVKSIQIVMPDNFQQEMTAASEYHTPCQFRFSCLRNLEALHVSVHVFRSECVDLLCSTLLGCKSSRLDIAVLGHCRDWHCYPPRVWSVLKNLLYFTRMTQQRNFKLHRHRQDFTDLQTSSAVPIVMTYFASEALWNDNNYRKQSITECVLRFLEPCSVMVSNQPASKDTQLNHCNILIGVLWLLHITIATNCN